MAFEFSYPKSGMMTLTDTDVVFTDRGQRTRIAYPDVTLDKLITAQQSRTHNGG